MIHSHFDFFESILEPVKYHNLKAEFIQDYIDNVGQPFDVDFENGIIYEAPQTKIKFSTYIDIESFKLKNAIRMNMYNLLKNQQNPNDYLLSELQHLKSIQERLSENNFGEINFVNKLADIVDFIEIRLGLTKSTTENYSTFIWNFSIDDRTQKLSALYSALVKQKIIKGSKQDFINGFQGKKVTNGVKWMLTTKDGKNTNKPTLFYFLDYLINIDYIEFLSGKDYNDACIYVFRDLNGNKFNRAALSTSKSNNTLKEHEIIKNIIDNL
jgi:hypothetical protein